VFNCILLLRDRLGFLDYLPNGDRRSERGAGTIVFTKQDSVGMPVIPAEWGRMAPCNGLTSTNYRTVGYSISRAKNARTTIVLNASVILKWISC